MHAANWEKPPREDLWEQVPHLLYGSGFRIQDSGFRVQGPGFRVQASGFRVQGSGFRVQGSGLRVQSSGFRGQNLQFHSCSSRRIGPTCSVTIDTPQLLGPSK